MAGVVGSNDVSTSILSSSRVDKVEQVPHDDTPKLRMALTEGSANAVKICDGRIYQPTNSSIQSSSPYPNKLASAPLPPAPCTTEELCLPLAATPGLDGHTPLGRVAEKSVGNGALGDHHNGKDHALPSVSHGHVKRLQEAYINSVVSMTTCQSNHDTSGNYQQHQKQENHPQKQEYLNDGPAKAKMGYAAMHHPVHDPRHSTGSKTSTADANASCKSEVHDFLSGFDTVSNHEGSRFKHGTAANASYEYHETPTYTSRSFDDFHRLLGKGLTPTNDTSVAGVKPIMPPIKSSPQDRKVPTSKLLMRSQAEDKSSLGYNSASDFVLPMQPFFTGTDSTLAIQYDVSKGGQRIQSSKLDCSANQRSTCPDSKQNDQYQLRSYGQGFQVDGMSLEDFHTLGFSSDMGMQSARNYGMGIAAVSDPSDVASDDRYNGYGSTVFSSNDSDGTQSDVSSNPSKRLKISTDEQDVMDWYNTLVQD
jgi:hypothetical protein